jgi:GNAT superfamily N-acetyltransferase
MHIDYLANHQHLLTEVAALHFGEWPMLAPDDSFENRRTQLAECCSRGVIPSAVIALDANMLSGFALLVSEDLESRPDLSPWLAGVYVKPEYRRIGVGSSLVRRVETEAKAIGVPVLYLYTVHSESLYARLGWQTIEHHPPEDGCVVMMRRL